LLGFVFMIVVGVTVALASLIVGTILSPALLIGPSAAALRLTSGRLPAMVTAGAIGLGARWLGTLLAYDSYQWPPAGDGWPVSFFVVALIFVAYLASGAAQSREGPANGGPDSGSGRS
jgi:zinc/manganese transport system permease protein